jgi:hypothetical protein
MGSARVEERIRTEKEIKRELLTRLSEKVKGRHLLSTFVFFPMAKTPSGGLMRQATLRILGPSAMEEVAWELWGGRVGGCSKQKAAAGASRAWTDEWRPMMDSWGLLDGGSQVDMGKVPPAWVVPSTAADKLAGEAKLWPGPGLERSRWERLFSQPERNGQSSFGTFKNGREMPFDGAGLVAPPAPTAAMRAVPASHTLPVAPPPTPK